MTSNIFITNPNLLYTAGRPEMMKYIPMTVRKVLDVGCSIGLFGSQIKNERNAEVWGIERNKIAAAQALQKIDKVIVGDVVDQLNKLPDNYFDCIVFNDILEHLSDPYTIIYNAKSKLKECGVVVCSIPNIRFIPNLRDLVLRKQWKYVDSGILDRTHLRFFTIKSIPELFTAAGYEIIQIEGIMPIKGFKFKIFNVLTLGFFRDTKFPQFACVVLPKRETKLYN